MTGGDLVGRVVAGLLVSGAWPPEPHKDTLAAVCGLRGQKGTGRSKNAVYDSQRASNRYHAWPGT
jgi:hypothetical protein